MKSPKFEIFISESGIEKAARNVSSIFYKPQYIEKKYNEWIIRTIL